MPVIAIGQPLSSSHRALDQPYGAEFPSPIPEGEEGAATVDAGVDVDMEGEADGSVGGVRDRDAMAGPQADVPVAVGGRQHVNNHSIDSGVAFNRSPVTIKTVPLPTAPLPLVDDDCDTPTPSTACPGTNTDSSRSWPHNALAGPSSSAPDPPTGHPSNTHSAVPPPAQPRRHRSGVLMSQARSRSRANSGGHVTGGFTSSKSFGELNLMGLHMSSMSSAMASASTTSVGNAHAGSGMDGDGSAGESEGWDDGREGRDGHGRRVTSEGSLRAGMDDGQMWDNSARFYHHLQSRPQSRQTSPDRLHTSTYSHRSGDASPTSSSTHTSPIYVRRSATLPHAPHGAGPPSQSHNHMQVNAHGHHAMHPSAALSPNQAFLSSHLPPIFNPSPGSSPEYGHAHSHGSGAHGLGVPQQHSMVILTPTTAEWKELKKEMGDMDQDQVDSSDGSGSGSGSGSGPEDSDGSISMDGSRSGTSDGTRSGESCPASMQAEGDQEGQVGQSGKVPDESQRTAAVSRTNGLMLDHNGSTTPDLDIPAFHRPPIRPTLSADFLSGELSHGPDPGASPPKQQGDSLGGEETGVLKWNHHHTHRGSLSAGPPVFMQKVIAPSPILPDTPSMADTPPLSPVIADTNGSDARAGQMEHELNGEEVKVAGEDEAILDEPTRIERFSSIGRRDSLKAVSKVRLPRTKTRRELERERLFKDLDEELEKDQDSPKAFEPVIAIGNGLGLVRDTSSGASSAPVPIGGTGAGLSRNSSLRTEGGTTPTRSQVGSGATGDSHADMARATGAAAAGASEGYFTTGARIEGSLGVNAGPVAKVTPVASVPARSQTDPAPGTATVTRTSPSQPIKPSPLHASPITALSAISSPSESPAVPVQIPKSPSATARTLSGSRKRTTSRPFSRTHSRQTSVAAQEANLETIRSFARSIEHPHSPRIEIMNPLASPPPMAIESGGSSPKGVSPPERRRRDTKRVSLVAGRVVQPFMIPPSTALPPDRSHPGSASPATKKASLNSFSPFRTPAVTPSGSMASSMHTHNLTPSGPGSLTALSALGGLSGAGASVMNAKPGFPRFDSSISVAASTAPPSEPGTPGSETAGGLGGRGIEDYCILSEAGKGAYGLVMRAKVKGRNGEPVGEEVIIKYIVKARILADCWKKHKQLGPIPVEIFVMDQLRHLLYNTPVKPHAWDPARSRAGTGEVADGTSTPVSAPSTPPPGSNRPVLTPLQRQSSNTPDSMRSGHSQSFFGSAAKYLQGELKISPDRGHPNICKLLDFFEDREFYYMVMPRFGSGLDLFDRVEACPDGLSAFEIRSLIGQLADAVRFLHQNGIVHRDIKDENVILDGEGRCQLIDFGSAAQWRPGKRWDTFSGTLHYASPEILRGELYSGKEQDVYALGTVMYVLLVGETPFGQLPDEVLEGLKEGTKAMVALQERCSAERQAAEDVQEADGGGRLADALDLVQRCLEMEVQDRPPADVLVTHRFVKGEGGWRGYRGWGPKK